jgi:hypothetical protein
MEILWRSHEEKARVPRTGFSGPQRSSFLPRFSIKFPYRGGIMASNHARNKQQTQNSSRQLKETSMLKKIVVGALVVVVMGAVGVGIIDAAQGRSVVAQPVAAQSSVTNAQGAAVAGQGQGYGRGDGGQGQGQAQGRGQQGKGNGAGGQGQTQNPNAGTPQANVTDWTTVTGTVNSFDGVGVSLTTTEGAPLWVQFGQSRYVSAQGVTFTAGDHLTVSGFTENGQYQAGTVTNDTTGQTLNLRDATGRPLWAGGGQH